MRYLRVPRALVWLGTRGALRPPPIMLRRPGLCRRPSASGHTHRAKRPHTTNEDQLSPDLTPRELIALAQPG
ncbi:hypothetical protein CPAR01_08565 [Colletotrichum paranaense]|nr:uncharacterized protein CPAR01_08565 [Colletotrichum paranaense]KAK1538452.1 hypothetical protein CPAR01_08565 [Colletotrichum paranaense]